VRTSLDVSGTWCHPELIRLGTGLRWTCRHASFHREITATTEAAIPTIDPATASRTDVLMIARPSWR